MKWTAYAGHIAFLTSVGLTFICVALFKAWHKRDGRRAPLSGKQVDHLPGQQLVQRMSDHHDELVMSVLLMFLAFPLAFSGWAGARIRWEDLSFGGADLTFLAVALGGFAFAMSRYVRHYRLRERARDGLIAERVTGVQLNRLVSEGCRVLHDVPAPDFNIDHVVISPAAVYAVETKSIRKPAGMAKGAACKVVYDGNELRFPDFSTREPIEQAQRQAKWLRTLLQDTLKRDIPVIPAVALPGWYILRDDAARSSSVRVFTPMGKGAEFLAKGTERLDIRLREMITQVVAMRYPRMED